MLSSNKKMLSDNLPEDLTKEIIVRLPVKSLLRFKCVSKSWYALITDHSFITKQLEWSNSINKNRCLKLILQSYCPRDPPPFNISLISKDEPYMLHDIELPLIPKSDLESISISNQCNGIFCICGVLKGHNKNYFGDYKGRRVLILWNPSTKEAKVIHPCQRNPKYIDHLWIGFGFDPITKDYKIFVRITRWPYGEEGQRQVEVYSLSTDSWRTIDVDVPNGTVLCYPSWSSYLSGAYHWLALDRRNNIFNEFILSFDFSKEVFGAIQLPAHVENVGVVDERLACVCYNGTVEFEIWVMNDYGVEDSWNKKFKIQLSGILNWSLLGFWGDNEILFQKNDGQLISYNLHNQLMQEFQTHIRRVAFMFDYVESLVPLTNRRKHIRKFGSFIGGNTRK